VKRQLRDPPGVRRAAAPTAARRMRARLRALAAAQCARAPAAGYRAVTLSLKRAGLRAGRRHGRADGRRRTLADRFSHGELRVTHDQNLLLPWVREAELPRCGKPPAPPASPRPTSAWSPT
jgi:sulfite reductase (NADPH) hemoprotein beta-component